MTESVPLVITPGQTPNVLLTKENAPQGNESPNVEGGHLAPPELTPSANGNGEEGIIDKPDELDKAEDRAALAAIPSSERSTPGPDFFLQQSTTITTTNPLLSSPGRLSPSPENNDSPLLSPSEKSSATGYFGFRRGSTLSGSGLEIPFPSPHSPGASGVSEADVERVLSGLEKGDGSVEEVDWSYFKGFSGEHLRRLCEALKKGAGLKRLALKGSGVKTEAAIAIAEALENNHTLEILNLERNRIGPRGIGAFVHLIRKNSTLLEVRLNGQSEPAGKDVEREIMFALEENQTLNRFSLQFDDTTIRDQVETHIHRNREIARKKHLELVRAKSQ
ncbi:Tropomodulin-1 [Rhizophlyctis rosea]|nr:Tropomodulin-1 [Rhizophlyctis rosea]